MSFLFIFVQDFYIKRIFFIIKINKVIGVDGIFLCLLKFVGLRIFSFFIKLINQCIVSGFWFIDWKIFIVFLIYKKGIEILKFNYCFVFVLLVVLKVVERVIFDQLYEFFFDFFSGNLFGFLKGYLCMIVFFKIFEDIRKKLDFSEYFVVIIIDFFKVFDFINYDLFFVKLLVYGVIKDVL